MNQNSIIPIHNFSVDDESSITFKILPLETRTSYDSSVPHRHNYYEIFIFDKGGGTHEIDFSYFPIMDKSIHFVSPGQVHKVRRDNESCGHLISFSRDFFYANESNKNQLFDIPFLNNNLSEPIINLNESQFEEINSFVQFIKKEYQNEKSYQKEVIHSYLNLLLVYSKRLFDQQIEMKDLYDSNFQKFRRLLEVEFEKNHSVNVYAAELGITEKQLSIITKRTVGKTALELIHERILLEAKRLIKHSPHSIKEIAYFLNFEDPSYFGKFFKNKTGLTPNEFRESN